MQVLKNVLINWVAPLVILFVVLSLVQQLRRPDVELVGGLAPGFSLVDTEGNEVALSDFRGKDVIVNFWGTWCGPCRAELPGLNRFAKKNPEVVMLGIAIDSGDWKKLAQEKKRLAISFPVLEARSAVSRAYGVRSLPSTFHIDEDGHLAKSHVGVITPLQLAAWVR